jgi:hypothetical protein
MKRARRLWVVALCAVPLSQLGHAISMELRAPGFPAAGLRHAYLAATLEGSLALLGGGLLAALVAVATARRLAGRPLRGRGGWPLAWLVLALAAAQLEIYFMQELLEGSSSYDAARYGLAGQLPVALVAALALRWLSTRLGPALQTLRARPRFLLPALTPGPVARLAPAPVAFSGRRPRRRAGRAPPY